MLRVLAFKLNHRPSIELPINQYNYSLLYPSAWCNDLTYFATLLS